MFVNLFRLLDVFHIWLDFLDFDGRGVIKDYWDNVRTSEILLNWWEKVKTSHQYSGGRLFLTF